MAVTRIDIETFLSLNFKYPVIDVRSEGEYEHAHIPGAISMPLFNNEERKVVGTSYKQQSKQSAIKIGLGLFGKKMVDMVETVEKLFTNNPVETPKTVVVHCWRGGMRSGGVGWLLDLYGFKVYTIIGGYKAYRQWGLQQFEKDYQINILGGFTGSGKSYVLQEMKQRKEIVIDLEALANHKGSAFGSIGMPKQPSQEMFENLLALELKKAEEIIRGADSWKMPDDGETNPKSSVTNQPSTSLTATVSHRPLNRVIWLEDESQRIGQVNIPINFFKMMRTKPVYFLDIPFDERLKHIVSGYGKGDKEDLVNAVIRIQKRLGGLETKMAISYLIEDNLTESFRILLKYYDKLYYKALHNRSNVDELTIKVPRDTVDPVKNAISIIALQTKKENV